MAKSTLERTVVDGKSLETQPAEHELVSNQALREYPHGIRLFLVFTALLLSIFLVCITCPIHSLKWLKLSVSLVKYRLLSTL